MTLRTRPRAPWHSGSTRRLAILRIGLPTLLACVFAAGPAMATEAPKLPPQAIAILTNLTAAARQTLDGPPGRHRAEGAAERSRDAS